MPNRLSPRFLLLTAAAGGLLLLAWWVGTPDPPRNPAGPMARAPKVETSEEIAPAAEIKPDKTRAIANARMLSKLSAALARKDARQNEVLLGFKDAAAMRRFLERLKGSGVSLLGKLDRLNVARVKIDDLAAFETELNANGDEYADLGANVLVFPPTVPEQDERVASTQVPFGEGLMDFLGATGDMSQWGRGVTVAILDSGVAPDAAFAAGKLRYLDVGMGSMPTGDDGHGTGVAALVAGTAAGALGVAPGADILSIRVTGADGLGDGFTLMKAIMAAADNGARVINISLGSYSPSLGIASAIDYANSLGSLVVASAGNDQATQLTWPAAYSGVVSVGAVDASGKQVMFSNSGEGLSITAPGYGVPTAWTDGQRVLADGTSFSAPIVSGSIAALMTLHPGITATQAWTILQQTASDGGPGGFDPDYGAGTVNLAWARHINDPGWFDTAISSHYVNPATGNLDVVVQNRGGTGVSGLKLELEVNGGGRDFQIPVLAPGAIYVASVPIDTSMLSSSGRIDFKSVLTNPSGQVDAVPKNNAKGSSLSTVAPK